MTSIARHTEKSSQQFWSQHSIQPSQFQPFFCSQMSLPLWMSNKDLTELYCHQQQINRSNHSIKMLYQPLTWLKILKIHTNNQLPQADTGANVSATNDINIIFQYTPFHQPETVQTFIDNNTLPKTYMLSLGFGYIKIISDYDTILNCSIVYTPKSNGTVLSPDNYWQYIEEANTAIIQISKYTKFGSMIFHSKTGDILTSLQLWPL